MKKFIILTGASGSGKTVVANSLKKKLSASLSNLLVFHFDTIEIPTTEEMINSHGSLENWQRAHTLEWISKIQQQSDNESCIIFEGQMRIAYLKEALKKGSLNKVQIILLDCTDEVRKKRLSIDRKQPELANEQMMSWALELKLKMKESIELIHLAYRKKHL